MSQLSGEARIDALCATLVNGHGMVLSPEVYTPVVDGSGSEKYGSSDWTAAGQDKDGFPVEKGSPEDVTEPEAVPPGEA